MLSGTLCAFGPTVLWSDPEIPCAFVVLGLPTLSYPVVMTPCFPLFFSLVRPHSVRPGKVELFSFQVVHHRLPAYSRFVLLRQSVFAHYVLLFAPLLACRAPETPVPRKAGHPTGLTERAGQQQPGPTTPDPELQANTFSPLFPVVRNIAVLCDFATPE